MFALGWVVGMVLAFAIVSLLALSGMGNDAVYVMLIVSLGAITALIGSIAEELEKIRKLMEDKNE